MKSIDKQVKDSLSQMKYPYDISQWQQAHQFIRDKERRSGRIILFWWAMGIAVLSSLIVLLTLVHKESETPVLAGQIDTRQRTLQAGKESVQTEIKHLDGDPKYWDKIVELQAPDNNYMQVSANPGGAIQRMNEKLGKESKSAVHSNSPKFPVEGHSGIFEQNAVNMQSYFTESETELHTNIQKRDQHSAEPIPGLPLLNNYLRRSFDWPIIQRPSLESGMKQLVKSIAWKYSALTELSLLTNVPGRSNEKAILGAQISSGIRMQAGSGLYFGVNLGYTLRTGTFGNMLDHPTPEYVFEKKEEGYRLVPSSLSYVHGQLYAGYAIGKWSVRLGLQPMYLVAATGTLLQYTEEVSVTDPGVLVSRVSQVSQGSISTPAFKNWTLDIQGGIEYALSKRWMASARLSITPGGLTYPLVSSTFDPLAGEYEKTSGKSVLKEQLIHFQLGIQYIW